MGLSFDTIGPNTDLVSGYIGNGGAGRPSTTADPDSIVGVDSGGFPINVYTALENPGDDNTPANTQTGGLVPTGILDDSAGTITMDLSGWFANFDYKDIHAGTGKTDGLTSDVATGTWNPLSGSYSLSWRSSTPGFGSALTTTEWTLEGVAAPLPLPAAVWLFGSGAIGLVVLARREVCRLTG